MPVQRCRIKGRPGYRWGARGTCFGYKPGDPASRKRAKKKAIDQGLAIGKGKLEK